MFQQMKYFIAVVDEHSFTRAAEKCNISQSAISQQIKELNQTVGTTLLKRQGRSFELTPAGKYFYRQTQEILKQLDQTLDNTKQIGNNEQQEYVLELGYLQMFGTTEFLKAVTLFTKQYPEAKVKITSGQHEQLFNLLRKDRIDVAFSDQRRALSDEYNNEFLTKTPWMINVTQGTGALDGAQVTTSQLADIPCILVAADDSEEQYCRDVLGIKSEFLNVKTTDEAKIIVASRQGYILTNERTIQEIKSDNTQALYLYNGSVQLFQNYYAYWKKDNSGYYIEAFADILKQQF